MKAALPQPVHESYKKHRKQRTVQIILPVVLAALIFIGLIVLINIATFGYDGDVGRWAAISTIWISLPVCLTGFVFFVLLGGIVYLLGRLLGVAPIYTGKAQDFVNKLAIRVRLIADAVAKPIINLDSFGATIRTLLGRK